MTVAEWLTFAVAAIACVLLAAACLPDWRTYLRTPRQRPVPIPIDSEPVDGRCADHPDGWCADPDGPAPRDPR